MGVGAREEIFSTYYQNASFTKILVRASENKIQSQVREKLCNNRDNILQNCDSNSKMIENWRKRCLYRN